MERMMVMEADMNRHEIATGGGGARREETKLTSLRASRTLISTSSSTASTSATSSVSDMVFGFGLTLTLAGRFLK
jgi:hypothetical protein